jgi:hypothetical protein
LCRKADLWPAIPPALLDIRNQDARVVCLTVASTSTANPGFGVQDDRLGGLDLASTSTCGFIVRVRVGVGGGGGSRALGFSRDQNQGFASLTRNF